jgi:hypothetical protein
MEPGEDGNKTKHDVSVYNWVRIWRYRKGIVECHVSNISNEITIQSEEHQSFKFNLDFKL